MCSTTQSNQADAQQRRTAVQLYRAGVPVNDIARELNRDRSWVYNRAVTMVLSKVGLDHRESLFDVGRAAQHLVEFQDGGEYLVGGHFFRRSLFVQRSHSQENIFRLNGQDAFVNVGLDGFGRALTAQFGALSFTHPESLTMTA
jgi:Homeodomain-like domain